MELDGFPFVAEDFADPEDFARGESYPLHYDVLAYFRRFARPIEHLIRV